MRIEKAKGTFVGIATALTMIIVVISLLLSSGSCTFVPRFISSDNSTFLPRPVDARITYFMPASGTYYPGEAVTSYLQFKNVGREPCTFWVGYSVMDQAEQWYHITSHQVTLNPGETSPTQSKTWEVPAEAVCMTGYYVVAMAVWDAPPEYGNATVLDYREQRGSFQVLRHFEQFDTFDADLWQKGSHKLGRSHLDPKNVDVDNGHARIRIPTGTSAGGELASVSYFKHGTYRASVLLPSVSGLITAFFLYRGPPGSNDEIDIEIYNCDGWQIEFTTWVQGVRANTIKKPLEFDPSAGYHEYRIDFYPQKLRFFVDGKLWQTYNAGLPTENMGLFVNAWFPDWLPCVPPSTDEYTYVDWVQY